MYNLWQEAESALSGIVEQVIRYDSDGLDIYFLNSTHALQGAKDSGSIRELFQYVGPVGESTPTEIRVRPFPSFLIPRLINKLIDYYPLRSKNSYHHTLSNVKRRKLQVNLCQNL